ncbi:MAG: hypothetical protein KC897_02235 [Candidatus Omnitrophica bacterium]|nr:hypothetical protein [Candidatus Omnitrophota bacterium]MCB9722250.1 hypothetical protein [Candidatus Omnitrophota bacterium]
MKKRILCGMIIVMLGNVSAVAAQPESAVMPPKEVFLRYWEAFMQGDVESVKRYMRASRAGDLTAEDLQYRGFFPPLVEVEQLMPGGEGVFLLTLRGTYVHPYEEHTMGAVADYEKRFGQLELVEESWDSLSARLPEQFARHLQQFVEKEGVREIWLLDIPGRAMVLREDGEWRVDVYNFDDRTMRHNAPRRLILPVVDSSQPEVAGTLNMPETGP